MNNEYLRVSEAAASDGSIRNEAVGAFEKKPCKTHIIDNLIRFLLPPIISAAVFTVYLFLLGIYPFGESIMASYDLLAQVIPVGEHFFDVANGKGSLFYSFALAGGADFFGTVTYCFASPLNFIFLLGGEGNSYLLVPLVLFAKIICISTAASYLIKRLFPSVGPAIACVISLAYTFSGYFYVANTFISWLDFMIYMPLAVVSFERIVQTGKFIPFSLSIAGMIYTCFSIACFALLLIFLILIAYSFICVDGTGRRAFITKICFSLVVAVGISLPLILPAFLAYLQSGRNTGLFTNLFKDLDPTHLYNKFSYILCDAVPFVICLFYFIGCDKKAKLNKFLLVATGIIFAPVVIDEVCLLLNAGSYMSYALRFGFLNSSLLLYVTSLAVSKQHKTKGFELKKLPLSCIIGVIYFFIVGVFIHYAQDFILNGKEAKIFEMAIFKEGSPLYKMLETADFGDGFSSKFAHSIGGLEVWGFLFFAIALCCVGILTLVKFNKMCIRTAAIILVCLTGVQLGFNFYHTVRGNKNSLSTYEQVEKVFEDILKDEDSLDGFRIKDYYDAVSADAPLTMHYNGYTVFSSVIDADNFVMKEYFDYDGNGINTIKGSGGNVFSDALLGYKYAFYYGRSVSQYNWKRITDYDGYNLFVNDCVLPICFTIPGGEYSITDGSYTEQLNGIYTYLGGEGQLVVENSPTKVEFDHAANAWKVTMHSPASTEGTVYVLAQFPEGYEVSYCAQNSFDEEYSKNIEGELRRKSGYTRTSTIKTYTFKSEGLPLTSELLYNSVKMATISTKKVKELSVKAHERAVDIQFDGNKILADTQSNGEEYLFVSYLAIDGYTCLVNGAKSELTENELNFLTVKLNEGDNEIIFKYRSPYVKYIILGLLCGAVLVALVLLAIKYYDKIKRAVELTASVGAYALSGGIFGFGICFPTVLFLIKCFTAIFS